ncbi:MAG: VanZ family protein [Halolamina sp.]|uniref:VanZ family protein n=1 Tax=Halolamina sp. TaxID=1940283 RepID=UPI002FC308E9
MRNRSPSARWTAVAVSTAVLVLASLVPSPFRRRRGWEWLGPDKFLHLVGHAAYAVSLATAFNTGRWTDGEAAALAVCASTIHSLATGRLQKWVPGRAFEPIDVLAGLIGAILAAFGWYAVNDAPTRNCL